MSTHEDDWPRFVGGGSNSEGEALPGHVTALLRHFADLRDRNHGGVVTRHDKEERFATEVELLSPTARQVLRELDAYLLLNSGTINETSITRLAKG